MTKVIRLSKENYILMIQKLACGRGVSDHIPQNLHEKTRDELKGIYEEFRIQLNKGRLESLNKHQYARYRKLK
jgi:hypothetical protein